MDNSGNESSGFVYFNTSSEDNRNSQESQDFLAFNNSFQASPRNQFKPDHYSSPQRQYRGSPRSYPPKNRRYQRWSTGNNSRNSFGNRSNSSYNSGFNSSSSFRDGQETNIAMFYHPSFLEDPWAELEMKLKEKQTQNSSQTGET